jgi:hypothetical protein
MKYFGQLGCPKCRNKLIRQLHNPNPKSKKNKYKCLNEDCNHIWEVDKAKLEL